MLNKHLARIPVFAYGSNICSSRMQCRVRSAQFLGIASAANWKVVFNKRGADGSGKANLVKAADHQTWGALWAIPAPELSSLDVFEPDYEHIEIEVKLRQETMSALAYTACSDALTDVPAFKWYVSLVTRGLSALGAPESYIVGLAGTKAQTDSDESRRSNAAEQQCQGAEDILQIQQHAFQPPAVDTE